MFESRPFIQILENILLPNGSPWQRKLHKSIQRMDFAVTSIGRTEKAEDIQIARNISHIDSSSLSLWKSLVIQKYLIMS